MISFQIDDEKKTRLEQIARNNGYNNLSDFYRDQITQPLEYSKSPEKRIEELKEEMNRFEQKKKSIKQKIEFFKQSIDQNKNDASDSLPVPEKQWIDFWDQFRDTLKRQESRNDDIGDVFVNVSDAWHQKAMNRLHVDWTWNDFCRYCFEELVLDRGLSNLEPLLEDYQRDDQ